MQSKVLPLVALITAASAQFEVTLYNGVSGCSATDDTTYRILEGTASQTCYAFDTPNPSVTCTQYGHGGADSPVPCTSDTWTPQSFYPRPDPSGSCQFFSDESCQQNAISSNKCVDTSATPAQMIKSYRCIGAAVSTTRNDCKMSFNRRSHQQSPSYIATVDHTIILTTLEDDLPGSDDVETSCSRFFKWQWGKGCGWSAEATTEMKNDWSLEHERYDAYADYDADLKLHGHDCDDTVLKCKGNHGVVTVPPPPVDGGGPGYAIHLSETTCSLDGTLGTMSDTQRAQDMQQTLMDLNLTSTWDGTWASLNYQANVADDRKPYTCNQVADKQSADSKCPGYWECVDTAASLTAYFPSTATFSATMSSVPTIDPIPSPVCSGLAKFKA